MHLSYMYNRTIAEMPSLVVETLSNMDLFKLIWSAVESKEHLGFAVNQQLQAVGYLKVHDNTVDCEFSASPAGATNCTRALQTLVSNGLPARLEPYIGRYIWFNWQGDLLTPVFDTRANVIGQPPLAMQALLEMWSSTASPRIAVMWDTQGVPRKVSIHQLPVMLLALMPRRCVRTALTKFDTLGNGFLRFFYHQQMATDDANAAYGPVAKTLSRMSVFQTYGTTQFLRDLSKEGFIWDKK